MDFITLDAVPYSWKQVEDLNTGGVVRVPRKAKKRAKKMGVMITAHLGKSWLAVHIH